MDLKWWKVKNVWLLAGMAGGVMIRLLPGDSPGIGSGLLGMIIPLLILLIPYNFGKIGAGDVKLFMVCGFCLGADTIPAFMLAAMSCGTLWFLFLVIKKRGIREVLKVKIHVAICAFAAAVLLIIGVYS